MCDHVCPRCVARCDHTHGPSSHSVAGTPTPADALPQFHSHGEGPSSSHAPSLMPPPPTHTHTHSSWCTPPHTPPLLLVHPHTHPAPPPGVPSPCRFDPLQKYGTYSYVDIMLDPLAYALSKAVKITQKCGWQHR